MHILTQFFNNFQKESDLLKTQHKTGTCINREYDFYEILILTFSNLCNKILYK